MITPIFDAGPEPVLLIGSNRSGKGACLVIPNLLLWKGSSVVLDPKGENWEKTAGWRKGQGQHVLKIDPTCTDGTAARWNPLSEMPPHPHDVAFVQNLVLAFKSVADQNQIKDNPHWEQTSSDFMAGVMLHVAYAETDASLARCFTMMTRPGRTIDQMLDALGTAIHDPTSHYGWLDDNGQPTRTHPIVAAAMAAVRQKTDGDKASVISTAEAYFSLFRDQIVAENTRGSDVKVSDLFDESQSPLTIYLTIPLHEQERCRSYLRMFFYQLWREVSTRQVPRSVGWGLSEDGPRQLLLLMDEFPVLGHMEVFEHIFPNLASLGVKVVLVAQTPAQIRSAYGRDESLTGNCKIKLFFRPEKIETAEEMSRMCGSATVMVQNRTYTGHRWSMWLPHVIASENPEKRALVEADEFMRLDDDSALLYHKGIPYPLVKVPYYKDEELGKRSEIPAPTTSDCPQGGLCTPMQWTLNP